MIERRTASSLCDSVPGPSHKSGFCSVLWMQPRYPHNQNQPVWLNLLRPVVWSRLLPGDCRVVKAKINQTFTNCKFSKCSLQIVENLCFFVFFWWTQVTASAECKCVPKIVQAYFITGTSVGRYVAPHVQIRTVIFHLKIHHDCFVEKTKQTVWPTTAWANDGKQYSTFYEPPLLCGVMVRPAVFLHVAWACNCSASGVNLMAEQWTKICASTHTQDKEGQPESCE